MSGDQLEILLSVYISIIYHEERTGGHNTTFFSKRAYTNEDGSQHGNRNNKLSHSQFSCCLAASHNFSCSHVEIVTRMMANTR